MSRMHATSYDEIPYSSNVFSFTHPDCLATWGTLLGMRPAAVDRCRLLELGCGTGANLLAMAQDLPGSQFLGIDLSPRQIGMGREVVEALRLPNIGLRPLSILDVDESFGLFDYIICHGVYSWVPAAVQDKILDISRRNLAPNGIAYVSYNTYPGWHIRGMIREMMGFHVRQFPDPKVRVQQARAFLEFLIEAVGDASTVYGGLLQVEADLLKKASDTYIFHEHLEEVNHPVYFHQFAERAADHGLQYLAEACPVMLTQNLSAKATQTLEDLAVDLIHGEQYLDFVRNRTFRRTLLCHREVALKRPPDPERVTTMHATALAKPVKEAPDLSPAAVEEFVTPDDARLSANDPLLKATLVILFESWPRPVPFEMLWGRIHQRLAGVPGIDHGLLEQGRRRVADMLVQCFLAHLVELHQRAPDFTVEISDRPVASPLARYQAANGGAPLANRRHRLAELDDFDRLVLRYLDGTRDRVALVDILTELMTQGVFSIREGDEPVPGDVKAREALADALEHSLYRLAKSAVLVG